MVLLERLLEALEAEGLDRRRDVAVERVGAPARRGDEGGAHGQGAAGEGVGDRQALHLARLELGEPARVGAAVVHAHGAAQRGEQPVDGVVGELHARVEPVGDVDVPRAGQVAGERRGAARHVGGQDRRRRAQAHRPPAPPRPGDVALVGPVAARAGEEALDAPQLRPREVAEVRGQVDDQAQVAGRAQGRAGVEDLARPRDRGEEDRGRQVGLAGPHDPGGVASGDRAPVDPDEVAELDVVLGDGAGRPGERRPAAGLAEPLGRDGPAALERAEPPDVADPPQPHRLRAAAGAEAGDGGGHGRVLEGDGRRLEHVDGLAAQAVQQQLAHQAAVVGVEPLRGGDEGPPVARPGARRRGQEEVDVQPGEAAGLQALGARGQREPLLPAGRDLVVAHVGGVAEVEGAGVVRGRDLRRAVVAGDHPRRARRGPRRRGGRGRSPRRAGRARPPPAGPRRSGGRRRRRSGPSRRPGQRPVRGRPRRAAQATMASTIGAGV